MKSIGKFFNIVLISIALFIFSISTIVLSIVFNKDSIRTIISDSNLYTYVNNEVKKEVKKSMHDNNIYNKEIENKIDELIDKTITESVLDKEFDNILKIVFSNPDKIEIDMQPLIVEYYNNINNYLKENNIELPQEIKDNVDKILSNKELSKIDINDTTIDEIRTINKVKTVIEYIQLISGITFVVLIILTLIIAKQKLRGVYIPLLINSIVIFLITLLMSYLLEKSSINIDEIYAQYLFDNLKNIFINAFYTFALVYALVAIILIIIKKILNNKCKLV
ncbi:MAG: hypothetical protein IJ572_02935 [Bacilli bacterium]|nr:hypothetical protein [Bacilli bacterium]